MQRRTLDILGGLVFVVLAIALLIVGIEFMRNYDFARQNVRDQLTSRKVFFPPAGKLTSEEKRQPGVLKYSGQQVDNGKKAQVYADQFIGLSQERRWRKDLRSGQRRIPSQTGGPEARNASANPLSR
jgi:hypothetical protein